MKEKTIHKAALAFYLNLGAQRSLQEVIRRFTEWRPKKYKKKSISFTSVKKWSSFFGWVEKADRLERKAGEKIEKKGENEYYKTVAELKSMKSIAVLTLKNKLVDMANKTIKGKDGSSDDVSMGDIKSAIAMLRVELGEDIKGQEKGEEILDIDEIELRANSSRERVSVPILK